MLHKNCMLVTFSSSLPPQTKKVRQASKDVAAQNQSNETLVKVTKDLFAKKDMDLLKKSKNEVKAIFDRYSLPYDKSRRIIATSEYHNFTSRLRDKMSEFNVKKQNFLDDYQDNIRNAQRELGHLFDPNDYMSVYELEYAINIDVGIDVVPPMTAYDELAGFDDEDIDALKQQATQAQTQKVQDAMSSLVDRLRKSLNHASSTLAQEDAVFRNTLVGNIEAALEAIETLNLTNDQALNDLADEVRDVIANVTADELRTNKALRSETAEETRTLVEKLNDFF